MLSKRLFHIASFIDENDNVADIGADHGKLVLFLANRYKNSTFLAVENKIGPYSILNKAIKKDSINNNIECSLSDGIEYLSSKIDTLIFAGMGGINVENIILNSLTNLKNIKKIVLCVNNKIIESLFFFKRLGYVIEDSDAVEDDNKIYLIFKLSLKDEKDIEKDSYSYIFTKIKNTLVEKSLYNKYIEKIIYNMESEKNSKQKLDYYEYSDNYLDNYLLAKEN